VTSKLLLWLAGGDGRETGLSSFGEGSRLSSAAGRVLEKNGTAAMASDPAT
jgi:hypothetical protein